jgi:HD superfamily phosphohydrolase YqeK
MIINKDIKRSIAQTFTAASERQGLHDHLLDVSGIARESAEAFNAGDWAYLVGLWHDGLKKWVEWNKISKKQSRRKCTRIEITQPSAGAVHIKP